MMTTRVVRSESSSSSDSSTSCKLAAATLE
jgi:hypothetical protein